MMNDEIRERGIPERINRTALGAMMARDPLHDTIVSLMLFSLFRFKFAGKFVIFSNFPETYFGDF